MANDYFNRFDQIRSGTKTGASVPASEKAPPPTQAARTVVARKPAAGKVVEPPPPPPPPAPTTVIRRRVAAPAAPPAPAAAAAPPVAPHAPEPIAPEPEPFVVAAPEPVVEFAPEPVVEEPVVVAPPEPEVEPQPEPVVQAEPAAAPEPARHAPSPAPAAAPVAAAEPARKGPAPSIEDLLGGGGGGGVRRVHKVLSAEEVAAKEREYEEARARSTGRTARLSGPGLGSASIEIPMPAAAPAAAAPARPAPAAPAAVPAAAKGPTLEELLRQEGIVQHQPKKGRRIIEDDLTVSMSMPAVRPVAPPPPPAPAMWETSDAAKNKPVRFLDPNSLKGERDGKGAAAKKAKGKRKEIMAQPDGLFATAESRRVRSKRAAAAKLPGKTEATVPAAHKRVIKLTGEITVASLAHEIGIKGGQVVSRLVGLGQMVTLNEPLDIETAQIIAQEFGWDVEDARFKESEILTQDDATNEEGLVARSPVVTIMGHVDHGKTSLLDAIRNTRVAEGEAGGITQHISAFEVPIKGQRIVFVDTPGHAAFTAMRARGAQITDVVVLVVAATEGVMPQTVEVIAHAKAAGVPIIVALNKIDLPEANLDRTKKELSQHGLVSEDWGGDVQMVEVSAKQRKNIDGLLESILLQSELMELRANPERSAQGRVVEAQLEVGRGPVATLLVQKGTLKAGDIVVAGVEYGRVRALLDAQGKKIKDAGPATPVVIMGLSGLPTAGDEFAVVDSDKDAKALVEHRRGQVASQKESKRAHVSLDDLYRRLQEGESKDLRLIVKADALGSVEALRQVFSEIQVKDIKLTVLHSAVGGITESDVTLASASDAIIVGFNVRPDAKTRKLAEQEKVDVRTYRVIYEAVEEIKQALVGMLEPEYKEKVLGHAEVREIFKIVRVGTVAGCSVVNGKVQRNAPVRLLRNSVVVWEGKLGGLRRFKDDVKEVLQGYECGISLDGYDDLKSGDVIESYVVEEIRPTV